jgi:tetrahydromethanopterin S-methyltransferase subunit G
MSQNITIPKECKLNNDFVYKTENIDTILQEADKDFEDFYWETGKYNGRDLGIDGYKDFIHSQITKAYEAGREDREIEFGKRIDDTIQFFNKLK